MKPFGLALGIAGACTTMIVSMSDLSAVESVRSAQISAWIGGVLAMSVSVVIVAFIK